MRDHMKPMEAGVRELKTRASQILARVRRGQRYVITHRGRPVALLAPVGTTAGGAGAEESSWDELLALGEQIGRAWKSPRTSLEALAESRR